MAASTERPFKRQRLSDPPELELHYRRERNDLRLKSTFESIFEKYGKDFGGIGDEIDLETGEIIVNNGHILSMVNERDAGYLETDSEGEDSEDWSDDGGVLASSLLLETRRRIGALGRAKSIVGPEYEDEELQSVEGADSVMGENDSLMGDADPEPTLPKSRRSVGVPYSSCDDEFEDKLVSSEVEWPTPRKAWPTPNKATPLSHTPWRSSPLKPVCNRGPSLDPAWRAPSLPEDEDSEVIRWDYDREASLTKKNEAKNINSYRPLRGDSSQASASRKPWRGMKTGLFEQVQSCDNGDGSDFSDEYIAPSKTPGPKILQRWTKAEEGLLRRLRTTTKLSYKEIESYFPGRKTNAITLHWCKMIRFDREREERSFVEAHDLCELDSSARSSSRESSSDHEIDGRSTFTNRQGPLSLDSPPATSAAVNDDLITAEHNQELLHRVPRPESKRKTTPTSHNGEIPNSTDPSELSLETTEPVLSDASYPPVEGRNSSTDHVIDEEETNVTTASLPNIGSPSDADSVLPRDCAITPCLSPQSASKGSIQREATGSLPFKAGPKSRSNSVVTPSKRGTPQLQGRRPPSVKKAAVSPSDQIDGSDDELSAPVKTVGVPRSQNRRMSPPRLSNLVLQRQSPLAGRRS